MLSNHLRSHLPRRYVKLILEELECRYVPSFLGLQIELPMSGNLPSLTLSTSPGATSAPATTTTTPSTISTSPSVVSISWSSTPSGQSTSSPSVSIVFTGTSAVQPSAPTASASGTDASSAGASSTSSSSAFHEGVSQGSGSTLTFPTFSFPALGIQAAQAGSFSLLGGTVSNLGFELLGNLPSLNGPANVMQGTINASASASQLLGAPYGGSVFGRLELFSGRTTGSTAAFGLTHNPPQESEDALPENPLTPPNDDWWVSAPQASEPTLPPGTTLLLERFNLPPSDLPFSMDRTLPVDSQALDALSTGIPPGLLFNEEDAAMPDDEEQSEERSGIPPALAILSCAVGAYCVPRFRSFRRVSELTPEKDRDV